MKTVEEAVQAMTTHTIPTRGAPCPSRYERDDPDANVPCGLPDGHVGPHSDERGVIRWRNVTCGARVPMLPSMRCERSPGHAGVHRAWYGPKHAACWRDDSGDVPRIELVCGAASVEGTERRCVREPDHHGPCMDDAGAEYDPRVCGAVNWTGYGTCRRERGHGSAPHRNASGSWESAPGPAATCEPGSLRYLQRALPYTIEHYSDEFVAHKAVHRDFDHAVKDLRRALHELENIAAECDHLHPDGVTAYVAGHRARATQKIADAVIQALRCASVYPNGPIDAQDAVRERVAEKFPAGTDPFGTGSEP